MTAELSVTGKEIRSSKDLLLDVVPTSFTQAGEEMYNFRFTGMSARHHLVMIGAYSNMLASDMSVSI